jgi:hypothetical protein
MLLVTVYHVVSTVTAVVPSLTGRVVPLAVSSVSQISLNIHIMSVVFFRGSLCFSDVDWERTCVCVACSAHGVPPKRRSR